MVNKKVLLFSIILTINDNLIYSNELGDMIYCRALIGICFF